MVFAALMRHAEVGVDHRLVVLDLVRRAIGDLDAVVERDSGPRPGQAARAAFRTLGVR